MHFVIEADGGVTQVALAANETGSQELPCCAATAIRSWKFPAAKGGGMSVIAYPFVLENR